MLTYIHIIYVDIVGYFVINQFHTHTNYIFLLMIHSLIYIHLHIHTYLFTQQNSHLASGPILDSISENQYNVDTGTLLCD